MYHSVPLREETIKNLEHYVQMGILERMTGMDNQDLCLSPMLVEGHTV